MLEQISLVKSGHRHGSEEGKIGLLDRWSSRALVHLAPIPRDSGRKSNTT